jgi:hypothetical protein
MEENIDYVICQWCGKKVKRIYGKHLKFFHPGKTSKEYKEAFPNSPLYCLSDKENISKNSGQFMKQEKWRKWASDNIRGDKNPMHSLNKSKIERQQASPFSQEFYIKRGLPLENRAKFIKDTLANRESDTRLDYYLKRGYSEDEAIIKLYDRQNTFSLEKCIKKYGEEEGKRIWKERQEKWKAKVFNKDTHISKGTSKIAENIIQKILKFNINNHKMLYDKNEKFIYDKENNCAYKYDLTNITLKKIIEINGIYWHCKPELYSGEFVNKVNKKTAQEIWDFDKRKMDMAKLHGYKFLIIWEDDFIKSPEEIIKECINFIYEENS